VCIFLSLKNEICITGIMTLSINLFFLNILFINYIKYYFFYILKYKIYLNIQLLIKMKYLIENLTFQK